MCSGSSVSCCGRCLAYLVFASAHARHDALQAIRSAEERVIVYVICATSPTVPVAEDVILVRSICLGDGACEENQIKSDGLRNEGENYLHGAVFPVCPPWRNKFR